MHLFTVGPEGDSSKIPIGWLIAAGALVVIVSIGIVWWSIGNNVTNAGNKKENRINAVYQDGQNYLSDCEVKTAQVANITEAQSAKFKEIIGEAVSGRYDKGSTAQVGDSHALFSAISEAYPDLSSLTFDKVIDVVRGCRTDYRDKQSQLQDVVRDFKSWRTGSWTVRHFGGDFPNDNLEARAGTNPKTGRPYVLTGKEALDLMSQVITGGTVSTEYQTGQLNTTNPFNTTTTTG